MLCPYASHSTDSLLFLQLLESRQSVLADDEVELWKSATVELTSDGGTALLAGSRGGLYGRHTHTSRLHNRPASENTAPVTVYNPEEANGQFTEL